MLKTIALRASIVTTAASRKSHPARQAISRCVVSSREMKYYAVKRGRQTGIFENWAIVEPLVRGFSGAEHKSFASLRDAEDYLGVPAAAAPAPSAGPSGSGAAAAAAGSQQASASGASHEAADVGGHQAAAAPQQPPPQQTAYGADGGTPPAPPLVPVNPALLYRIEFDGAARGNPGPAGCGAFIVEHGGAGREVKRCRRSLGVATNNEAEYQGLILGMQAAAWLGVRRLLAQGDSQLICLQVSGEYQVKAPHLRPLVEFVRGLAASFDEFNLRYVPREQNTVADDLSNQAIDLGTVL